ncbi:hypothetical protein BDQ94DRAFT_141887 [Aspergillus welwitschiae]|uniref:Uncharacterized protein n=1 Tax=Aspergillus welwitschiae TaxID=1341132 RepID=A0A3F3Q5N8_9EURO|nr:hypothetical protein BDQ94DRAFT_141887 [Aspergillus welwitschiae]RDH34016.1 hypothetical protein BDQ94DRAFT_141887 [Aspergillus welwitschiae]
MIRYGALQRHQPSCTPYGRLPIHTKHRTIALSILRDASNRQPERERKKKISDGVHGDRGIQAPWWSLLERICKMASWARDNFCTGRGTRHKSNNTYRIRL